MIYLQLFLSMFQIGLLSFGGGYASIPLIQQQIVDVNGWLTLTEFTDIITIAQMTPGPIAINAATFIGTKVAGFCGSLIATFANVLAPTILVLVLAKIYYKYRNLNKIQYVLSGIRPVVVALIASATYSITKLALFGLGVALELDVASLVVLIICLIILRVKKASPVLIIILSGVLYYIIKMFI